MCLMQCSVPLVHYNRTFEKKFDTIASSDAFKRLMHSKDSCKLSIFVQFSFELILKPLRNTFGLTVFIMWSTVISTSEMLILFISSFCNGYMLLPVRCSFIKPLDQVIFIHFFFPSLFNIKNQLHSIGFVDILSTVEMCVYISSKTNPLPRQISCAKAKHITMNIGHW